jgi:hypothetical protein
MRKEPNIGRAEANRLALTASLETVTSHCPVIRHEPRVSPSKGPPKSKGAPADLCRNCFPRLSTRHPSKG